ncbi:hypothetical protein BGZ83_008233 [Gryganskiella cystojenkinii]|nr:hypothetical protein BGZ83_008233 [Gryganskiella cystojenkinii]
MQNDPGRGHAEKTTYAKSSRKARDADVLPNENAVPRKINPTSMIADAVASRHPIWGSNDSDLKEASSLEIVTSDKIFQEY